MATNEERRKLLGVRCPHCLAAPGERCSVPTSRGTSGPDGERRMTRRLIRTLDGGAHNARWQAALGRDAQVDVEGLRATGHLPREPVAAGGVERPW